MSGRGPQTFKKRQKEQHRKERQQEKVAKKQQRKLEGPEVAEPDANDFEGLGLLDIRDAEPPSPVTSDETLSDSSSPRDRQ